MRLGRTYIRIGWSMWPGLGWHRVDGYQHAPVYTRHHGDRVVFGRGGVVSIGGIMLWWTSDAEKG